MSDEELIQTAKDEYRSDGLIHASTATQLMARGYSPVDLEDHFENT